jgi:hypothetical protein
MNDGIRKMEEPLPKEEGLHLETLQPYLRMGMFNVPSNLEHSLRFGLLGHPDLSKSTDANLLIRNQPNGSSPSTNYTSENVHVSDVYSPGHTVANHPLGQSDTTGNYHSVPVPQAHSQYVPIDQHPAQHSMFPSGISNYGNHNHMDGMVPFDFSSFLLPPDLGPVGPSHEWFSYDFYSAMRETGNEWGGFGEGFDLNMSTPGQDYAEVTEFHSSGYVQLQCALSVGTCQKARASS